jgi:hypothetical protein
MERASGASTAFLNYLQERQGKVVTIDEMEKVFAGKFDRRQIMSNMGNLINSASGTMVERLQTGVWRFVGDEVRPAPGVSQIVDTMDFLIVKTSEDGIHMVGIDDKGGIYKISKVA